jgi:hypothetical protein
MNEEGWMCTRCPVPCQQCRAGGNGPFCERTPCYCECHDPNGDGLADWYEGPLNKQHIAELRHKLASLRGFLYQLKFDLEDLHLPQNAAIHTAGGGKIDLSGGTLEEINRLLEETSDF